MDFMSPFYDLSSPKAAFLQPAAEVSFGGVVATGNERLRGAVRQQRLYLVSVLVEFALARAGRSPQLDTQLLLRRQRFLCALRDEVTLDLRRHRKRHCHYLGLDRTVQLPVTFDGVNADVFLGGHRENLHALQHGATQPRQLADDEGVLRFHLFEEITNGALFPGDAARGFLLDPGDMAQLFVVGELEDVGFVLLEVLIEGGDAEISESWCGVNRKPCLV